MGRTLKPTLQDLKPEATSFEETPQTALYWFGMLPASGSFKLKRPTREKDPRTNDYYTYADVTSQELWEGEVNQWVGKCPWKQSLSINGLAFDAFTETLMRAVGQQGGLLNRHSWPGAIGEFDEQRFKDIIKQCYRNVVRVKDGIGKDISLDQSRSYQMLNDGTEKVSLEQYNPRTDTYFAHYVYVVKIEGKKPEDFDAGTYYRLATSWDEFFRNPPKSVAEAYPMEKAAKPETPK
jgi:hypothetical protein